MPKHQYSLDLITHTVNSGVIEQRASDGYINASQLCTVAGKQWYQYFREETAGHFRRALANKTGISEQRLIEQAPDSDGRLSTWVHPQIALHLAQWLSADFAVQVTEWIQEWMSGGPRPRPAQRGQIPYHLERHMANVGKVPLTHFSILQEMTMTLIAPLEALGYSLPPEMVPDISQGRMFCKFAREQLGLDTDALPTYTHSFPDGREVQAKLYPVIHLGHFRKFISETWMPERAEGYFRERDPQALPLLDKVLKISYEPPRVTPTRRRLRKAS